MTQKWLKSDSGRSTPKWLKKRFKKWLRESDWKPLFCHFWLFPIQLDVSPQRHFWVTVLEIWGKGFSFSFTTPPPSSWQTLPYPTSESLQNVQLDPFQSVSACLGPIRFVSREWPRYCRKVYWTKMVQNGPNGHFGQNDLILNWILAFARPKWTKMVHFGPFWPEEVHFGPFRSANRTLAIPEFQAASGECWGVGR